MTFLSFDDNSTANVDEKPMISYARIILEGDVCIACSKLTPLNGGYSVCEKAHKNPHNEWPGVVGDGHIVACAESVIAL